MTASLDFRSVEAFVEVVRARSFTSAARRLHLTPPTVSARISTLEQAVGTRLLDRGAALVETTPAGAVFLPHARKMLETREEAARAVTRFLDGDAGLLEIGASSVPGTYLLPPLLARTRHRSPGLRVRLQISDSETTVASVRARNVELGVVGRHVRETGLTATRVGTDEIVLVAAPDLISKLGLTRDAPRSATLRLGRSDLAQLPFVFREDGSATRAVALEALGRVHRSIDDLDVVVELGSNAAIVQACLAGVGATFVTRLAVREALSSGKLVRLSLGRVSLTRPLVLVRRRGSTLSPSAARLARLLREETSKR